MALAASFLGGAKSRLLPAAVPLRFFAAAVLLHIVMWASLFFAAEDLAGFRGGLGPALASTHLLTLGVLAMTAMGAAAQLLPVATRRALVAVWPVTLSFWLFVPGLCLAVAAMALRETTALVAGAMLATAGLLVFAVLTADNLRRAGSLGVVAAFGWAAVVSLVGVLALALLLALDFEFGFLPDHGALATMHALLGGYGFMGMLALGFSHVLIPMFALSRTPDARAAWTGCALALSALVLAVAGALAANDAAILAAGIAGLAAAGAHVLLMRRALALGMRKRLGLSFVLVKASWAMLAASICAGLAAWFDLAGQNGAALFGTLLLVGWLATFLFAILQRILPFLVSMHAAGRGGLPPLMSELSADRPLRIHAACHGSALALLVAAILLDAPSLTRIAAVVGTAGAIAFAAFALPVVRRALATG